MGKNSRLYCLICSLQQRSKRNKRGMEVTSQYKTTKSLPANFNVKTGWVSMRHKTNSICCSEGILVKVELKNFICVCVCAVKGVQLIFWLIMIIEGLNRSKNYGAIFPTPWSQDMAWRHYFPGKALSTKKLTKNDKN